jgi:uncharacterized protein YbcC (UPF0753/DUF2309 family)
MLEYEALTKRTDYSMGIRKFSNDLLKHNRLTGLVTCYHLMRYGKDVKEQLQYWGVSDNIKALETKILQEKTKLHIESIKKDTQEKTEDLDKLLVLVENSLNRNLDSENISVKKWVYLCQSIEDRAKKLEQHGRRQNKI